jgi:DNA-binding transcriptional LysR family regulator
MAVDPRLTMGQIERLGSLAAVRDGGPLNARERRDARLLERRLGAPLIAGEYLLRPPHCRDSGRRERLLAYAAGAATLAEELSGLAAGTRGQIDLVASLNLASYRLPSALGRFSVLRPDVHVRMHVADTDRALELVATGRQALAIVAIEPRVVDGPLRATRLGDEPTVLVAAADSDDPPSVVSASELARLPFVEADRGGARRDRELRRAGIGARRIVIRLGHPEAMKTAVRAHIGVAMMPASAVAEELSRGELRQITVEGHRFGVPICLVEREDAPPPTAAAQRLIAYLVAEL